VPVGPVPTDMQTDASIARLRLALPKGRTQAAVVQLLTEAGLGLRESGRGYRPDLAVPGFETKLLKPQNIVEMLHLGTRDLGFAGVDWMRELGLELVEVLDTGLDPVEVVAAAPRALLEDGRLPRRHLVVASEYERLAGEWAAASELDATIVRSYGATEVFPPEDADLIVDNTASGATLRANELAVVARLMASSTRLWASPRAWADPERRERIERFALLVRAVLDARRRVMLELNVPAERLEEVCAILPCMREPTIALLHGGAGYAVRAAVPKSEVPRLVPELRARGGTDLVVSTVAQIVP
jgi:ATP phosphoribosyltransferase